MYLEDNLGMERIAIELNKMGCESPGGKVWSSNAVNRLLVHEFHMGIAIYGKFEWKRGRDNARKATRKKDKSEWFIGKGNWEILKTEEEHQQILQKMPNNNWEHFLYIIYVGNQILLLEIE